jgi:uncharacterized membrane protein YphA (DoxX/SURF4 family)
MNIVYLAASVVFAVLVTMSGVGKLRRDPYIVKVVHETVGVPMAYLPLLAAAEIAGALGLIAGIFWPPLAVAAAIGLVLYFAGAIVSHLLVGDAAGIGGATTMLVAASAVLALRVLTL